MNEFYIAGMVFGRQEVYKNIDGTYYIPEKKKKGVKWFKTILCPERVSKNFKQITKDEAESIINGAKVFEEVIFQ